MTLDYFKASGTDYALGLAAESEAARRTGITGMRVYSRSLLVVVRSTLKQPV